MNRGNQLEHSRSGVFAGAARRWFVSLVAGLVCVLATGVTTGIATGIATGTATGTARAQTNAPPDSAVQASPNPPPGPLCITLNTITSGEILSGHELHFQLRDGTKLMATLARDCPQLKFHGRFTYQAVRGRLCAGEGRILARSGEACMISSFSTLAESPDSPLDPPIDGPGNNPTDSQ